MGKKQTDQRPPIAQSVAVAVLAKASDEQRIAVAEWARDVLAIRESKENFAQKALLIAKATHRHGLTTTFLEQVWTEAKRVGWDERTGAMRGVLAGSALGLIASLSGPMAGVAAFGTAVGLPIILLGAGGGALVAALIEEGSKHRKK
ncbi:hypothetical protein [Variovorax sp. Root318D1]|uniref:hypothetical protein n=1 Tax=Variovorax sp. Root318D1 TaxID=1736513 RepID=UPI000ADC5A22|nr:hypothetical protein [Variovorax sp. Root318D1]